MITSILNTFCLQAKMLKTLKVPLARASVVWIIGEYRDKIPEVAPDALRELAKTFCDEVRKNVTWKPPYCDARVLFLLVEQQVLFARHSSSSTPCIAEMDVVI